MESKIENVPPVVTPSNIDDGIKTDSGNTYQKVDHPMHYNNYNVEVIDMMEKIWGTAQVYVFCTLNAFKYRMRMGTKPGESLKEDLEKEHWYLQKADELKKKLEKNKQQ